MEASEARHLYTNEDVKAWRSTLDAYDDVLQVKANKDSSKGKAKKNSSDLVALDHWYQNELPKSLHSRENMYLTLEELCQLMKWKLTRGKFRPRLSELVKANDETTVQTMSEKAFKCLPDVPSAIRELSKLKAIGPATASAILAAASPDLVPFMADEAMMAIPNLGEINYKLPFYTKFMEKITRVLQLLKKKDPDGEWTAHKVELALWTEVVAKKYNFDISFSDETKTNGCKNGDGHAKRRVSESDEETVEKGKKRMKKSE